MNGFVSAASTALFVAGAPIFGMLAGRNSPPQPFDDKVVLQGKVPETRKSIASAWVFQYQLDDARLESGPSNLLSNLTLTLNEDGTYRLMYVARWNVPNLDGRNVVENGHFSLSGEILLLEPDGTSYMEVKGNKAAPAQPIANEKHTWIVRLDKAHLSVAGRCASYQVDPVCREAAVVWFTMKAQLGTRWLGREPR